MFNLRDFPIKTDEKWFMVVNLKGKVMRKFSINKYEMDHVRAWREGYVKGLNDR